MRGIAGAGRFACLNACSLSRSADTNLLPSTFLSPPPHAAFKCVLDALSAADVANVRQYQDASALVLLRLRPGLLRTHVLPRLRDCASSASQSLSSLVLNAARAGAAQLGVPSGVEPAQLAQQQGQAELSEEQQGLLAEVVAAISPWTLSHVHTLRYCFGRLWHDWCRCGRGRGAGLRVRTAPPLECTSGWLTWPACQLVRRHLLAAPSPLPHTHILAAPVPAEHLPNWCSGACSSCFPHCPLATPPPPPCCTSSGTVLPAELGRCGALGWEAGGVCFCPTAFVQSDSTTCLCRVRFTRHHGNPRCPDAGALQAE